MTTYTNGTTNLRDVFAEAALAGLLQSVPNSAGVKYIVTKAYEYTDAMIEARTQTKKTE